MTNSISNYIKIFSNNAFSELKENEDLSINLHSENSQFVRFNQSKVRQNTSVDQHEVQFTLNKNHRTFKFSFNLNLDSDKDLLMFKNRLELSRSQIDKVDENPQFVEMKNNGVSENIYKDTRPQQSEILQFLQSELRSDDCVGFWTSGPVRKASLNSKGQSHFFETDHFFFDYSLYNGPKAAKGFYSDKSWNESDFKIQLTESRSKLSLLNRPSKTVPKGKFRTFLEPMAVAEILGTLSWGAFGIDSYNQGRAPLKKLKEKEKFFSKKFTLLENLNLGFSPAFNSLGELSPKELTLIENGELKNMLVSSASAKEYSIESNFSEPHEMLRSPEIRAGALDKVDILKTLDTGLYLSNLHYINWSDIQTARLTGMTRFACFWVENGEIVAPIQDLRFDETIYNLFGDQLVDLTRKTESFLVTDTYRRRSLGGMKIPGALINEFNFTL